MYQPTVHLFHCLDKVLRIFEADKPIALAFARPLISNHFGPLERWKLVEGSGQQLIVHIIAQISTKYAKIIVGPVSQRVVLPNLPARYPNSLFILFVGLLFAIRLQRRRRLCRLDDFVRQRVGPGTLLLLLLRLDLLQFLCCLKLDLGHVKHGRLWRLGRVKVRH